MVKKGNIIQILDYELGVFSETLELEKNWTKRIFGLSLHKKSFSLAQKLRFEPIFSVLHSKIQPFP